MENAKKAVSTGGNLGYWTGAAKSKDFYGTNAIDVYNDSPDYRLSKLGDNVYGFEFNDASRQGSMYLKSLFFVPADASAYMLTSKDTKSTALWTPNSEFAPSVQMNGITGMKYNDLQANSYVKSLEDLFNAVLEGKVCVSNDGSTTSFWWNPYVIENTKGSITSMSEKETQLIGKN